MYSKLHTFLWIVKCAFHISLYTVYTVHCTLCAHYLSNGTNEFPKCYFKYKGNNCIFLKSTFFYLLWRMSLCSDRCGRSQNFGFVTFIKCQKAKSSHTNSKRHLSSCQAWYIMKLGVDGFLVHKPMAYWHIIGMGVAVHYTLNCTPQCTDHYTLHCTL